MLLQFRQFRRPAKQQMIKQSSGRETSGHAPGRFILMTITVAALIVASNWTSIYIMDWMKQGHEKNAFFQIAHKVVGTDLRKPEGWFQIALPAFQSAVVTAEAKNDPHSSGESGPPMSTVPADNETSDLPPEDGSGGSSQSVRPALSTNGRKVVFIYHTHNRESFLPHLPDIKDANDAYNAKINITMVGKRLAEELEKRGIGSEVSTVDYMPTLSSYSLSYAASLKTVEAVMQKNKDLNFFIDVHRDSRERDQTTVTINGKKYAKVAFVIGQGNPHWQQNEELAKNLKTQLEDIAPGISRPIVNKEKTAGTNGEYNQSLSSNALLVEIGGPYNSLEEEYRSVEVLAQAFANFYWDAQKVDLPVK
jgi:stage II sporulation protein P